MWRMLRATVPVGAAFGLVMGIAAFVVGFLEKPWLILLVAVVAAVLSGLGGTVAGFVDHRLAARGWGNGKTRQIAGFFSAAAINMALVLLLTGIISDGLIIRPEVYLFTFLGLAMGAAYGIYRYRMDRLNERMRFLEELHEKNRLLEEASRQLAIIEERNRMGRELHDSVSQGLHGITFAVTSLRHEIKDPSLRTRAILDHLETAARATLDELRTMIDELKPSLLAEKGLNEAVRMMAGLFSSRRQIPVEVNIEIGTRVSPEAEMTVYRVCQEALANIEQHADPRTVSISLKAVSGSLSLTVKDDGVGFDTKGVPTGNGLHNMRSRVEEAGGTFEIISKSGLGTSLTCSIPLL